MTKVQRFFCVLFVCAFCMGCLIFPAGAVDIDNSSQKFDTPAFQIAESTAINGGISLSAVRSVGYYDISVPANSIETSNSSLSLDVNDIVTINASYTPSNASVDFGLIAPDGLFYSVSGSKGGINKGIQVSERGYYTFAVRNNSSFDVSVTGYINC